MANEIQSTIEAINDIILAVTGINGAPDYPKEKIPDEPYCITYYGGGNFNPISSGFTKDLHNIVIELHVFRKDLERDVRLLMPFIDSITAALLADVTLGGNVSTYSHIEASAPQPFDYAGTATLAIVFTIVDVKINK